MHIERAKSLRQRSQGGFTLIELIVVIVILGILAATALPKFAAMGGDARIAKLNAARASIKAAAVMYHGRWVARGSPTGGIAGIETGVDINGTGYPTADTIGVAAGLATDYNVDSTTTAGTASINADATISKTSCVITYTESDGAVSAAPATSTCE